MRRNHNIYKLLRLLQVLQHFCCKILHAEMQKRTVYLQMMTLFDIFAKTYHKVQFSWLKGALHV